MGTGYKAMIGIHVHNSQNSRKKKQGGLRLPSTPSQDNFVHPKQDMKLYIQNLC